MSAKSSLSLLFLWSISSYSPLLLVTASQGNLCLLCQDGLSSLHFPNAVIKSDGTTCTGMALSMATNFGKYSDSCNQHIQAWRQICCGDEEPVDVEITEVLDRYPDIDSIETIGPYNKCDLCRDGDYPSSESMVIHMLYVGAGTCPQYWKAGQQGLIPNHLCDPLQYFAYEPCGCGEFSTNGEYRWDDDRDDSPYSKDTPTYTYIGDDDDNTNNNNNNERPWWSSANGNHAKSDDEPWWAAADSYSGVAVRCFRTSLVMSAVGLLLIWL